MAASGDIILPRGMPCWSATASRTVRRPSSRIRAATSSAAAARPAPASPDSASPYRPTNPGCPTPEISVLTPLSLGPAAHPGSGQPGRQPERREDPLRLQEERHTADPPARHLMHLERPGHVPARRVRLVLPPGGRAVDLASRHHDRVRAGAGPRLEHPL